MYPIERYLKTLKRFVQNKTKAERDMAKRYALEKALGFCTEYIQDFITMRRWVKMTKKSPT